MSQTIVVMVRIDETIPVESGQLKDDVRLSLLRTSPTAIESMMKGLIFDVNGTLMYFVNWKNGIIGTVSDEFRTVFEGTVCNHLENIYPFVHIVVKLLTTDELKRHFELS